MLRVELLELVYKSAVERPRYMQQHEQDVFCIATLSLMLGTGHAVSGLELSTNVMYM